MKKATEYIDKVFHFRTNTIWGKYIKRLLPGIIVLILAIDISMYMKVRNDNFENTDRMARQSFRPSPSTKFWKVTTRSLISSSLFIPIRRRLTDSCTGQRTSSP